MAPNDLPILPGYDPECPWCDGYGVNPLLWAERQVSEECYFCAPEHVEPASYDADGDGWIDGVTQVRARFAGGRLPVESITRIVMHRLSTGKHAAGPRYFALPRTRRSGQARWRKVSAHFVVHAPGWNRMLTQCVPINRVAWHGGPGQNFDSIGIEHDGPSGTASMPRQYSHRLISSESCKPFARTYEPLSAIRIFSQQGEAIQGLSSLGANSAG